MRLPGPLRSKAVIAEDATVVGGCPTACRAFPSWERRKWPRFKCPNVGFVISACASFLFSVYLWFSGRKPEGAFVGLWVPSILSFGTLILGRKSHE